MPMANDADISDLTNWQVYKRLLRYAIPFWVAFAVATLGNTVYAGASTAMAWSMEFVIEALQNPTTENRRFLPLLIISVFTVRGVGFFLSKYYMNYVGRNIVNVMRVQVFDHLMRVPSRFYDQTSSGHLVSKITFNIEQVTSAATEAVTIILREGLTVVGLLGFMFYTNWKLTLLFLAVGPIIGWIISYVSRRFRRISRRIQYSMGDVTHVSSEAITGYRVVRTFGGAQRESGRFRKVSRDNLRQSLKMAKTQAISTPVVQVLVSLAIGFLIWVALSPEFRDAMSTGQFVAFITAASTMAKPVRQLTSVHAKIQKGIAASQSIFESIDYPEEEDSGTRDPGRVDGRIDFGDVWFHYDAQYEYVLQGINLTVAQGETVALVGRSGSGKSTLVSLIPRFYELTEGDIRIDGISIREFTLESLRRQIALVTQSVVLFNDTVASNIAYGEMSGASRESIREAARKAHALSFIENLPDGFDTVVGDNGVLLSGGQRQRLAIARALIKDAPILILDEATSSLDTESERHIQEALEEVMAGRTTLVIAHRLSTIESADRIAVMDGGRLAEIGSHHELMERDGAYAALHRLQFSEEG
ncbi:lipid A export permease/ATP-binding protein MsbA [Salicola sp. Rm-C-2C1-2]|uniref:lipid A export permease/ATP-binding protein MsbA n=1 Tax=Salicola sp. Rm-C-2C1-2 TaxID=3141321 RepID=UPI0032E50339